MYLCRLESRKKGELPKKMEIQNDELSALQKRLEEKKKQRQQEQAAQRIGTSAEASQRTRSLINQKVCNIIKITLTLKVAKKQSTKFMSATFE